MSENIKMEDLVEKVDSTSETTEKVEETKAETKVEAIEQDPLKIELERVQRKGKTEKEKAEYSLKKNAERVKELGGDPNSILGIEREPAEDDEDETPVTVGMLKKLQQETASKTSLQQADEIENDVERELVKYHLQNTIKSTGLPNEDLKLARALVNAVKNTQIIEEVNRKSVAKTHSTASGVDAVKVEEFVPTLQEQAMMRPPFKMSKEDILAVRAGKQFKFRK